MDTLYHYCSNDAFLSIIQSCSIRLSSLSLSNDSMEGKWFTQLLTEEMSRFLQDESERVDVRKAIGLLNLHYDSLGFCLSEEKDLLSQWRGYADDGKGVSIGFSNECLGKIADRHLKGIFPEVNLRQVKYDRKEQDELTQPICDKLKELIKKGALKGITIPDPDVKNIITIDGGTEVVAHNDPPMDFVYELISLADVLFVLKAPGFEEEREWRLIAPYHIGDHISKCSFSVNKTGIIPHHDVKIREEEKNNLILKVTLGPKNPTPKHVVDGALKASGIANVEVKDSNLSYR